jgi:hypothetical protein
MATDETDAKQVLEAIRADEYAETVSAGLLSTVYEIEHDKQFEVDRGQVQANLRDLITEDVPEAAS